MTNKFFNTAFQTSLAIGIFSLICIGVVVFIHNITLTDIIDQKQLAKTRVLSKLLTTIKYDNQLTDSTVSLPNKSQLGIIDTTRQAYVAQLDNQDVAIIIPVISQQGYSGTIEALVAVDKQQEVIAVGIVSHTETPGLGDKIESSKSNWIEGFNGRSLANTVDRQWDIKKYQGDFDQITAATITSRAVIQEVQNVLSYLKHNPEIW